MEYEFNFNDSLNDCRNNRWKLFQIDSNETQQALFFAMSTWWTNVGSNFYIDGMRDKTDGKWYYFGSGDKFPVYSGLEWINGKNNTPPHVNGTLSVEMR
jgi:hypothetical protein